MMDVLPGGGQNTTLYSGTVRMTDFWLDAKRRLEKKNFLSQNCQSGQNLDNFWGQVCRNVWIYLCQGPPLQSPSAPRASQQQFQASNESKVHFDFLGHSLSSNSGLGVFVESWLF